jgi:short-subunit dehydrogenase
VYRHAAAVCGMELHEAAGPDLAARHLCRAAACSAAKHALTAWSKACCEALRCHNIKVVLICPSIVNTTLVNHSSDFIPEKMIQPEDVAEAAMFAVRCSPSCVPEVIVLRECEACTRNEPGSGMEASTAQGLP